MSVLLPKIKAETVFNLFKHLSGQSYQYFLDRQVSQLSKQLNQAMNGIEPLINALFTSLLPIFLALIFSGLFMATVSIYFMIVLWCWSAVVVAYTYYARSQGLALSREYASTNQSLAEHVSDCVLNINNVIYNAAQEDELTALKHSIKKMAVKDSRVRQYVSRTRFFHGVLSSALLVLVIAGLVAGYNKGTATVGQVVFILSITFGMSTLVTQFGVNLIRFARDRRQLLDGLRLLNHRHTMV